MRVATRTRFTGGQPPGPVPLAGPTAGDRCRRRRGLHPARGPAARRRRRHRRGVGSAQRAGRRAVGALRRPGPPRRALRRPGGRRPLPVLRRAAAGRGAPRPRGRCRRVAAAGSDELVRHGLPDRGAAVGEHRVGPGHRAGRHCRGRLGDPRRCGRRHRRTRHGAARPAVDELVFDDVAVVSVPRSGTSLGPSATRQVIVGVDEDQEARLPTSLASLAGGTVILTAQR